MKILIQQACIIDRQSPHHGGIRDILIENGHIRAIGANLNEKADRVIRGEGVHVSPGWVDVFSHFCDPGYEYKETLETGAAAAAAGGFTDVFVIPNTRPVIDSKSQVEYIRQKSRSLPVNVWPIGAMTRSLEGKDLAEMYDMRSSGAIAFGDGTRPVQSAGLLLKGLQYIKTFRGVIIQVPDDSTVGANGLMNEGIISTRLGLPGKPMMAEELIIARDIELARYTGSKIHFTGVSSPRSLQTIREARESGLDVSCSVTPQHLFFTDADLVDYDTNLKIYPPLRDQASVKSLRDAVLDGTVDCMATHHFPQVHDNKIIEFEYAQPGMTGLETAYAALHTILPQLSAERTVELLSSRARSIFGLAPASVVEGGACSLTVFDPGGTTRIGGSTTRSKSKNTAFLDRELKGRVIGIINGEKEAWNDQI
ncbi:MAG: dihydroorotase [Bacteroidota bacterium]|nr:dihydroorotase [Bacteroidota bacterium]MDP4215836.1 dihydroorotase [Bacteroidota bacterium]MDP4255752.1 dihydroorotase [Bacteroidota bacterium]MDP4260428.1 dihydroorotase [Bacteroidota bacterium]